MKKTILVLLVALAFNVSCAQETLCAAAKENNIELLKEFKKQDVNFNQTDSRGFTALILAVYNDQLAAVAFLLKNGAKPNVADNSGNTALMGATFKGNLAASKLLVAAGADINQRNLNGATALIFAATFNRYEIATLLLNNKADKTIKDNRDKSALDHSLMQENKDLIQLLSK
jgi:hypothetical protein